MGGEAIILCGDVREQLATLPDRCVQTVVTSPPYWGLRDYGTPGQLGLEATPEEYVANMVAVFREVRRVLRDDGTLWLNLGDSYASDLKGSGGQGKSGLMRDGRDETQRLLTADVSISHQKMFPRRLLHGLKPKDLVGIPWRVAFALQADGWYLRSDIIWSKPNPMPESVTDRPTKAHEYLFLLTKRATYFYDADAIREEGLGRLDRGPQSAGRGPATGAYAVGAPDLLNPGGRNKRTVWTIATQPFPSAHFATFPEKLVEPCILAGSRPLDTVLDPFAGSGTTLAVAKRLDREGIGIELNPEYVRLAERRIAAEGRQIGLFAVGGETDG